MKVLLRSDSWCGRVAYLHFLFTSHHQRAILFRKRLKIDALAAVAGGGITSMELRPPNLYKKFPSLVTAIQVYHTRINKNFITDRNSRMALSSFFYAMIKRIRASREVQREIDNEVLLDTTTTADTTGADVVVDVTDDSKIKKMFGALSDADLEIAAAGFEGRGKTKQVLLQREQRISNKRERERTQNSFDDNDNDKLQQKQQQPPPRLPQQQQHQNSAEDEEESTDDDDDNDDEDEDEVPLTLLSCLKRERERTSPSLQQQKKKQKKTIANRKNTTTNDVVNKNNDEIMISVSLSPSASKAPLESDESASESVVMSVSSETQQLPSTTDVVGTGTASTLLVHEKHATTTHAAATASVSVSASASLLSSSPVATVLATDSLRRTMEGSHTPDTTTRMASAVLRAAAPVTSISYPLVQPSPSSVPPPIAAASANTNANTNAASGNTQIQDSFRFHGQDLARFNTLFNVELEYIHNRKNGRNLQVNFTGIAAMMNCDIQQVMSHFDQSGREQEIEK